MNVMIVSQGAVGVARATITAMNRVIFAVGVTRILAVTKIV